MDFSDKHLIQEIRDGSQLAFNTLMQRYDKLVYRVAFRHTNSVDNALDITQNVFLKVYSKLDNFSGSGSFKAWLMRITHNEAMDWLRKNWRIKELETLDETNTPVQEAAGEKVLEQRQFKNVVEQILPKLNDRQRVAVSLRFFEEMPLKEIARVLGCSEGNVKNLLFRSMEKLRGQWVSQESMNYE